ncbi:MAG: DUF3106 domain-containing protein [Verrucomicrobiota bacterium]
MTIVVMLAAVGTLTAQQTNPAALLPPALPSQVLKSPVTFVRELLAMNPAERRLALSNRPPEVQKKLLAKLREYQSLRPDERELKLRATELQWYLQPLMTMSPTNRSSRLAQIPAELRPLVEERLARWDQVPAATREELLNQELTARYFTQLKTATELQRQELLAQISPERRAKLEAGLDRWTAMSSEQRDKTLESFNAFFLLTGPERNQALSALSESEQRQMEKTLQAYANLDPGQRAQCIRSFEKFAGMKIEERQAFLKNAERWKLMSHEERQTWRELVHLAPMMPPANVGSPVMPPKPKPARSMTPPAPSMATNLN